MHGDYDLFTNREETELIEVHMKANQSFSECLLVVSVSCKGKTG